MGGGKTAGVRERVLCAAGRLLADGGHEAVSTRAVSAAAGVQAPVIYRIFGDKQGLLDAVTSEAFRIYLDGKAQLRRTDDPVADLRHGWDLHVAFGLAHPALYTLMYGAPRAGAPPPAAIQAEQVLAEHVHRIARAGRLRVPEVLAAHLIHATANGIGLALLARPESGRDPALSAAGREAVITAIATDAPATSDPGPAAAALALVANLPEDAALSTNEKAMLGEWLDRIADPHRPLGHLPRLRPASLPDQE